MVSLNNVTQKPTIRLGGTVVGAITLILCKGQFFFRQFQVCRGISRPPCFVRYSCLSVALSTPDHQSMAR